MSEARTSRRSATVCCGPSSGFRSCHRALPLQGRSGSARRCLRSMPCICVARASALLPQSMAARLRTRRSSSGRWGSRSSSASVACALRFGREARSSSTESVARSSSAPTRTRSRLTRSGGTGNVRARSRSSPGPRVRRSPRMGFASSSPRTSKTLPKSARRSSSERSPSACSGRSSCIWIVPSFRTRKSSSATRWRFSPRWEAVRRHFARWTSEARSYRSPSWCPAARIRVWACGPSGFRAAAPTSFERKCEHCTGRPWQVRCASCSHSSPGSPRSTR